MKVALVSSSAEPVGVSTHVLNLARLLSGAEMLEVVICPDDGWLANELKKEGLPFEVVKLSYKPSSFVISSARLLNCLVRHKSAKVVHLHGRLPLFLSLFSMMVLSGRQFVATVHQFSATGESGLFGWKNRMELFMWRHFVQRICCVSAALFHEVIDRIGARHVGKVTLIRNWISPVERLTAQCSRNIGRQGGNDVVKLIGVGRLSREKGFDVLIEALRMLASDGICFICDIFGSGPEEERLRNLINRYGLQDHVRLAGYHENIRSVLNCYDVIIIPSRMESFGLVGLEAYDSEVPVIASDIPGLNEIVHDRVTGLLFSCGEPRHLAEQVKRLVHDPALRESLVREAKRFVRPFMSTEARLEEFRKFYNFSVDSI